MPRVRSQLAIQAPPELLERLRAAAAGRGQTVTRMLLGWIEAGLAGDLPGPGAAGGGELLERLQALEATTAELRAAVAQLHAQPRRSTERATPARPSGGATIARTGDLPPPSAGAITTAALAARTGTNRDAWNNWAARPGRIGEVRDHPQAGPWRLVGKAPAESGGPPRWLWEPA